MMRSGSGARGAQTGRRRTVSAACALALCGLTGCGEALPWLGLSSEEKALAARFDHARAVAVCERNLRVVAGPQGLSPGASVPAHDSYGGFAMAVSFWRTSELLQPEHQCLVDAVSYAVIEWRTPMIGAERIR